MGFEHFFVGLVLVGLRVVGELKVDRSPHLPTNNMAQDIVLILPPNPPPKPPHAKPTDHPTAATIATVIVPLCLLGPHSVECGLCVRLRREGLAKVAYQQLRRIWTAP